jgi:hypothetical protein
VRSIARKRCIHTSISFATGRASSQNLLVLPPPKDVDVSCSGDGFGGVVEFGHVGTSGKSVLARRPGRSLPSPLPRDRAGPHLHARPSGRWRRLARARRESSGPHCRCLVRSGSRTRLGADRRAQIEICHPPLLLARRRSEQADRGRHRGRGRFSRGTLRLLM